MDSELARLKRMAAADNWEDPISIMNYFNALNRFSTEIKDIEAKPPELSPEEKCLLILKNRNKNAEDYMLLDALNFVRINRSESGLSMPLEQANEILDRYSIEQISRSFSYESYTEIDYFDCVFVIKDGQTGQFWKFSCTTSDDFFHYEIIYNNIEFSRHSCLVRVVPIKNIVVNYVEVG